MVLFHALAVRVITRSEFRFCDVIPNTGKARVRNLLFPSEPLILSEVVVREAYDNAVEESLPPPPSP
jgi:hypothetical protein